MQRPCPRQQGALRLVGGKSYVIYVSIYYRNETTEIPRFLQWTDQEFARQLIF